MREEYFPAVHKGATRAGQVTSLTLMQRQNETNAIGVENEFWWHMGWDGFPTVIVGMDDNEVERKFEAFKARMTRIGLFNIIAEWPEKNAS
jgi:hypothetical protein